MPKQSPNCNTTDFFRDLRRKRIGIIKNKCVELIQHRNSKCDIISEAWVAATYKKKMKSKERETIKKKYIKRNSRHDEIDATNDAKWMVHNMGNYPKKLKTNSDGKKRNGLMIMCRNINNEHHW